MNSCWLCEPLGRRPPFERMINASLPTSIVPKHTNCHYNEPLHVRISHPGSRLESTASKEIVQRFLQILECIFMFRTYPEFQTTRSLKPIQCQCMTIPSQQHLQSRSQSSEVSLFIDMIDTRSRNRLYLFFTSDGANTLESQSAFTNRQICEPNIQMIALDLPTRLPIAFWCSTGTSLPSCSP